MSIVKSMAARVRRRELVLMLARRTLKDVAVPLGDGAMLRADVFKPRGKGPWPTVVSAYPYQKDGLAGAFVLEAFRFASEGYAFVLADLRGTGASDGNAGDPFSPLRADDLCSLVEWTAEQTWCDGRVGMAGISYGGAVALKAAAARPAALRAICTIMAPAAFYDDVAFPGGSLSMMATLGSWGNLMNLLALLPPLYRRDRPDWAEAWRSRLADFSPTLFNAAEHTLYDDYWKNLEVHARDIGVPVMMIEGWRGFSCKSGLRLFEELQVPKRLLIGPWVHVLPSSTDVVPIDHRAEVVRWFDHWLKGARNGIGGEPERSVFVLGSGRWKCEQGKPSVLQQRTLHLHPDGKLKQVAPAADATLDYSVDPAVGTKAGLMSLFSLGIDYPANQAQDNERSLSFDSVPLAASLELVGEPRLRLTIRSDMPDAAVAAKLCDVAPDGFSTLITQGWKRLSRRNGLDRAEMPEPGREYELEIDLWPTDYEIRQGNRLRLTVALSDFPHVFPLPYKGGIKLLFGPRREQRLSFTESLSAPTEAPHFEKPGQDIVGGMQPFLGEEWLIDRVAMRAGADMKIPLLHFSSPLVISHHFGASVTESEPGSAVCNAEARADFGIGGISYSAESVQTVSFDRADVRVRVTEKGNVVFEKTVTRYLNWV